MTDLFAARGPSPLADRMRPATLEEYVGQEEVLRAVEKLLTRPPSMILWGPPGCGKTTLARLIAQKTGLHFLQFSAVTSGVKEVKEAIENARWRRQNENKGTVLFVDEIHRFNRAQQDAFLGPIEDGTLVLIGATTENPSFEVNAPLLSRCRVFTLKTLTREQVITILERATARVSVAPEPGALDAIADLAGGDARNALNILEMCGMQVTVAAVKEMAQRRVLLYDKDRDQHYDTVSALIKSMRGSDVDAALYWLARMLEGGEDPMFLARRLVIFASEDVGNADPRGLMIAVAAKDAVHFIGMPEGYYPLSQAVTYLATAPKSNASGEAYKAAKADVEQYPAEPVPLHLRNAVTGLMKASGYGKGYEYAHDQPGAVVSHGHRPPNVEGHPYYTPADRGYEITIRKLMEERKKRP
ncbi:MAG TPA: replication-associated recombination protein A [Planctomycetota bacterium]|nr:replication-associated recombination protein A [Planctomycetota bacterium]